LVNITWRRGGCLALAVSDAREGASTKHNITGLPFL
jgi:hypothetical protein